MLPGLILLGWALLTAFNNIVPPMTDAKEIAAWSKCDPVQVGWYLENRLPQIDADGRCTIAGYIAEDVFSFCSDRPKVLEAGGCRLEFVTAPAEFYL